MPWDNVPTSVNVDVPFWFAALMLIALAAWLYTLRHWPQERCGYCHHCKEVHMWKLRQKDRKDPPSQATG